MPELDIKTLHEEVNKTFETFKQANDQLEAEVRKHGQETAESRQLLERVEGALTELRGKYEELVKQSNRPSFDGESRGDDPEMETRKSAFLKMVRYGAGEAQFTDAEKRSLSGTSDSDGGFFVPPTFENTVLKNAYNEAEIRPYAQVSTTGRDMVVLGKLAKAKMSWGTKGVALSAQELDTGAERLEVFSLRGLVLIANDTLDDSEADIWQELIDLFSAAKAEAEDEAFAIGSGAGEPLGFANDSRLQASAIASGVSGGINDGSNNGVDKLVDMLYSLKKKYRRNATWAFNSTTEGKIRQLKNADGDYLWQPPVQAGAPATLLGKPVMNPEGLPDIVAGAVPIAVGDFRSGYKIRDRAGMSVQRLGEKYSDIDQTGFLVKSRTTGGVVLPEAFKLLKIDA
jgi:HK97 family phage major capsid protein